MDIEDTLKTEDDRYTDDLRPARGILIGAIGVTLFWIMLVLIIVAVG